jgi:hypothetical protein
LIPWLLQKTEKDPTTLFRKRDLLCPFGKPEKSEFVKAAVGLGARDQLSGRRMASLWSMFR